MNNYVRTTDGRIVSLREFRDHVTDCAGEKVLYLSAKHNPLCVYKIPYVKQADTIEELCDAFVRKSNEPGNPYFEIGKDDTVLERKFENYRKYFEHYDYYGMIWVGKDLISVAKMNEKGVLELL